jgi:hypothetical protein
MENRGYQINRDDKSSSPLRETHQVYNDWVGRLLPNRRDSDIFEHRNPNEKSKDFEAANSDSVFLGWQKTPSGEVFPLYNVTAKNHPLYHSTVSERTLRKQNLKIPLTPPSSSNEKRTGDE